MSPIRHIAFPFKRFPAFLLCLVALVGSGRAAGRQEWTVAQDGSGRFRSIQAALDAVPADHPEGITIVVRNGVYHEKLFIVRSDIAIVGEDQDSTRIEFPELRSAWNASHGGSDWGSAVVNIDSGVTDVTIANLTIHNTYGSQFGSHDHQFAIRGNGTRIILLNCTVIADGGDTVSLWNREQGMYYHANCRFEGWVDFVCPRGWCYITDSRFFGHNLSASIWHDGSANRDQKLVIRYSGFDGVPGFPLGRHHRDAQIFLLDCLFSRAMADKPIYLPVSPNATTWVWGPRHYFFNCHREGGDFDWFRDNVAGAQGVPMPAAIDAKWTFGGMWDPEATMPAVLSTVSMPVPRDGAYGTSTKGTVLRWLPALQGRQEIVRIAEDGISGAAHAVEGRMFSCTSLKPQTRYAWHVDEIVGPDTVRGPEWHFTTGI